MYKLLITFILLSSLSASAANVEVFSEEERLKGFVQHRRKNAEHDQIRLSGRDEIKKKREAWEEQRTKAVDEYKAWKKRQATRVDESSPEYFEDLAAKKKYAQGHEESRKQYNREQEAQAARRKTNVKLSEAEELGLEAWTDRADVKKRALYGGKPDFNSVRGRGSGISSGYTDFAPPPAPPPQDFNQPPPQPPEFFEPEIPPPPPPPEFEEPIPPPVFDDPDF